MSNRILALLDNEKIADQAAKELTDLGYDELQWQFVNAGDDSDVRIMPGIPARSGTDMVRPVGFIQETDPPPEYALTDLDISDEEKAFFAKGLERNAILILVDAPDEAIDEVEKVLSNHNAGRYTEA
jgi:hypothetical protein